MCSILQSQHVSSFFQLQLNRKYCDLDLVVLYIYVKTYLHNIRKLSVTTFSLFCLFVRVLFVCLFVCLFSIPLMVIVVLVILFYRVCRSVTFG